MERIKNTFRIIPPEQKVCLSSFICIVSKGVTFKEYNTFCLFLNKIHLVNVALEFCKLNGNNIDKPLFKHIVKSLIHVTISDHLVDLIFAIFDENGIFCFCRL